MLKAQAADEAGRGALRYDGPSLGSSHKSVIDRRSPFLKAASVPTRASVRETRVGGGGPTGLPGTMYPLATSPHTRI